MTSRSQCRGRLTSPFELKWEFEPEGTSFSVFGGDSQSTFVELDDLAHEG
jgi:hypothetical protein